jgi:hypothetical protein
LSCKALFAAAVAVDGGGWEKERMNAVQAPLMGVLKAIIK